jgi:YQGE family putative transporter
MTNIAITQKVTGLTASAKVLLSVVGLNSIANSISGIFINIYWYKLTENFYQVALFNFISYVVWFPVFLLAGWVAKRFERKTSLWIGSVFQILFFVSILILGERSIDWIVWLGILFGIGSGFYWLAVNVLSVDLTRNENRDRYNGINGIVGSITQMIGPLLAGWIVTVMPRTAGYSIIFALSFVLFLLSLCISFMLPNQEKKGYVEWKRMLGVYKQVEWRKLSYSFIGLAFRDGVLSFVIWLWVYKFTRSEGLTGNIVFVTTALSIVVYFLIAKYSQPEKRYSYLVQGTICFSAALVGLIVHFSWVTLILYSVLGAICRPLFDAPFNTLSQNAIQRLDEAGELRMELVMLRESALSIGRISSVGSLALLYSHNMQTGFLSLFLFSLLLAGLVPIILFRR